jgi:hypothetical protein
MYLNSIFEDCNTVTTQSVWWCAARATTLFNHFRPRFARAEMVVLSQPESLRDTS